ncbi:MAG TPA: DUF6285 domain-containing protein [Solirubrobacteraceae bacterium]|jgi:hypothetical protein
MTAPHDQPDAQTLIEAVREFLAKEVEPQTEGRLRYHVKVAANVLAIVERELRLGEAQAAAHQDRLRRLGFRDDDDLAAAIRAGALDGRLAELEPELRAMVADKLAVARPGYGQPVNEAP